MAVLVTADVPGQIEEGLARMMTVLEPMLRQAKGFIAVGHGLSGEGMRVFEVWESQEEATRFFADFIRPNLSLGITPKRSYLNLCSLVIA